MDLSSVKIIIAILFALFAGLATFLGAWLSIKFSKINTRFLSIALGFSAGVMIYISFMELLPDSYRLISENNGDKFSQIYLVLAFFGGISFIWLIDKFLPNPSEPHEVHLIKLHGKTKITSANKLQRMGWLIVIAITLHNFPEGIATFISTLNGLSFGIPIALAIAIHNIPEGIAVAIPIYQSTGSKKKAYSLALLAGLAEPLGAVFAFIFLYQFISSMFIGLILAVVAGIMVFISFDELLPTAQHCSEECGEHQLSIYGLFAGMATMAISLLLLL